MTKTEAIQTIKKMIEVNKSEHRTLMEHQMTALEMAIEALSCEMGEWEHIWNAPDGTYKARCNQCGFTKFFIEGHDAQYEFCPSCGSKMDMATEALEGKDTNVPSSCSESPNRSDLISRQDAIDALSRAAREKFNLSAEYNQYLAGLMDAQVEIKYLPSANPDLSGYSDRLWKTAYDRGYERCRQDAIDAIVNELDNIDHVPNWVFEKLINGLECLPSAQPEPCEDAVSRHRLLSDLKELIVAWEKYPVMAEQIKGVEAAIGYVELIPSAQPERTGRWIPYEFGGETWHQCTACGVADKYIDYVKGYDGKTGKLVSVRNYCPNCGADMRGET